MNNKLINVLIFVAGGAVGSLVTYKIINEKCEQRIQEEVDSVKDALSNRKPLQVRSESQVDNIKDVEEQSNQVDAINYSSIIKKNEYSKNQVEETENKFMEEEPYIIEPDEFGMEDDFETRTLTWYADEVLADENDKEIKNYNELVGTDFVNHFGEYEDDTVYVRNDILQTDYEIELDVQTYANITKNIPPHRMED